MLPKRVETVSALTPGPEHSDEYKKQPNGISNPAHVASPRVGGDQSRIAGPRLPHTRGRCSPATTQSGRIEPLSAKWVSTIPRGAVGARPSGTSTGWVWYPACDGVCSRCCDERGFHPSPRHRYRPPRFDPNGLALGESDPFHRAYPQETSLHHGDSGPSEAGLLSGELIDKHQPRRRCRIRRKREVSTAPILAPRTLMQLAPRGQSHRFARLARLAPCGGPTHRSTLRRPMGFRGRGVVATSATVSHEATRCSLPSIGGAAAQCGRSDTDESAHLRLI